MNNYISVRGVNDNRSIQERNAGITHAKDRLCDVIACLDEWIGSLPGNYTIKSSEKDETLWSETGFKTVEFHKDLFEDQRLNELYESAVRLIEEPSLSDSECVMQELETTFWQDVKKVIVRLMWWKKAPRFHY